MVKVYSVLLKRVHFHLQPVGKHRGLELNASSYQHPAEGGEKRCGVGVFRRVENEVGRRILNHLKRFDGVDGDGV